MITRSCSVRAGVSLTAKGRAVPYCVAQRLDAGIGVDLRVSASARSRIETPSRASGATSVSAVSSKYGSMIKTPLMAAPRTYLMAANTSNELPAAMKLLP
jgi:hypothetical protein